MTMLEIPQLPSLSFQYIEYIPLRTDMEDREARLRAQEDEMQQRDAEISILMAELRRCQAQIQRQQV